MTVLNFSPQVHEQNLARLEAISAGGSEDDNPTTSSTTTTVIADLKKMFRDGRELLRLNHGLVEVERERLASDRKQLVRKFTEPDMTRSCNRPGVCLSELIRLDYLFHEVLIEN